MNDNNNSSMNRRTVLTTTAGTLLFGLAGCSGDPEESGGDESSDDNSEDSSGGSENSGSDGGNDTESDSGGSEDTDEAAEDVENRPEGENKLTFQDLEIIEHEEEVVEEFDEENIVISGVVENSGDEEYSDVFVEVRAYNADGHQIDAYLDTTSSLQAGGTWAFEVDIFDIPADEISEWDIGVWGYQF